VIPEWLHPIRDAAGTITVHELTRFMPPDDHDGRVGAVLLLFGDGPGGHDLLLTERSHTMRSHPGQVSFPGGSLDEGEEPVTAALREAEEETGLDPAGVEVFGTLPPLWLPPSNFAVTPVLGWWARESPVSAVDPAEVHAVLRVPLDELLDPARRVTVQHPARRYRGPGFLLRGPHGPDHEVLLWGFTAHIVARLFDFVGWTRPWDETRVLDLPRRMLQGEPSEEELRRLGATPNTRFSDTPHDHR
jgi:8-oxo-dGTP pyrophosphatase MutT (NUDIX family)